MQREVAAEESGFTVMSLFLISSLMTTSKAIQLLAKEPCGYRLQVTDIHTHRSTMTLKNPVSDLAPGAQLQDPALHFVQWRNRHETDHTEPITCWKRKDSDRFFWLSCHSLKWRTASSTLTMPSFTCSWRVISCRWPGVFIPAKGSYILDWGLSLHGLTRGSGKDGKTQCDSSPTGEGRQRRGVNVAGHGLKRTCLKRKITCGTKKGDI